VAIVSFDDGLAETFYVSGRVTKGTGWANATKVVRRKLDMVQYAQQLSDLNSPPGNHLEALAGDLTGWHSIRVNNQWRVIFVWQKDGAHKVRIVDYH
jgi:toxin HigB-1